MKIKYELRKVMSSGISCLLNTFEHKQATMRCMGKEYQTQPGKYYIKKITSEIIASKTP